MQFELSAKAVDATTIAAALHPLDPDARIALDPERCSLEVISTATAAQVEDALHSMGYSVKPLKAEVHISGGSTCCGGCT